MVRYTVLVPMRDAADAVARLLPQLVDVLDPLLLPYEILCVDDASCPTDASRLDECRRDQPSLRVLRFDRPRGTSAALTAGLAAARGEVLVGLDPDNRLEARLIPHLISRLARYDLVVAQAEQSPGGHVRAFLARWPRLLAADPLRRAGEDMCFAARREAVAGLTLARGAFRVLPELLDRRGYRVCRLIVAAGLPPRGQRYRSSFAQRLLARLVDRHFEPHLAREQHSGAAAAAPSVLTRGEIVRQRLAPGVSATTQPHGPSD